MPPKFALGWRKDRPGEDMPAHHLVRAVQHAKEVAPLPNASLLSFRGDRQNQGGVGACWAFARSRAFQLYWQANGMGINVNASQRKLYYDGRLQEYAGQDPETVPPLTDTGTEPRMGDAAVRKLGISLIEDCPYVDSVKANNVQPPPAIYEKAYDSTGMKSAVITDVGSARVQLAASSLIHRLPVEFGMQVDSAFLDNHGERITKIDGNRIEGGHMLAMLAVLDEQLLQDLGNMLGLPEDAQPDDVLFDNWWGLGDSWGTKHGYGVMAGSLFGSNWIADIRSIQAAPLPRKAA